MVDFKAATHADRAIKNIMEEIAIWKLKIDPYVDEFESLLRRHIYRQIRDYGVKKMTPDELHWLSQTEKSLESVEDDDEQVLIDLKKACEIIQRLI